MLRSIREESKEVEAIEEVAQPGPDDSDQLRRDAELKNMPEAEQTPASDTVGTIAGSTEGGLFSTLFSLAFHNPVFEAVMARAGTYVFLAALIINLAKLALAAYKYYKSANKNLSEKAGLGWSILQVGLVATAIVGSIAATAAFVMLTPILFVSALSLDTLRNFVLLMWNIAGYVHLRYSERREDKLTTYKKDQLLTAYTKNIKEHGLGFVIGLLSTAAAVGIFLLPHVTAATAAFAATAIAIGTIKTTLAGLVGIVAGSAIGTTILWPVIVSVGQKVWGYGKSLFAKIFGAEKTEAPKLEKGKEKVSVQAPAPAEVEKAPLLGESESAAKLDIKSQDKFVIQKGDLDKALKHRLKHHGFFDESAHRDFIIKHVIDRDVAIDAIQQMVTKKLAALKNDVDDKKELSFFKYIQKDKRTHKKEALEKILEYFKGNKVDADDYGALHIDDNHSKTLLEHISKKYPDVDKSFFRNESDTRNILKAVEAFQERFAKKTVARPVVLPQVTN